MTAWTIPTALKTADYTLTVPDLALFDIGAADLVATLPAVAANAYCGVKIQGAANGHRLTVAAPLGATIDGLASFVMSLDNECTIFQSNGVDWIRIANEVPDQNYLPSIVWRPGAPSSQSSVETWAEAQAFIAQTAGHCVLYIDGSLANAVVTAATPPALMRNTTIVRSYSGRPTEVIFEDGAVWDNPLQIYGPMTLETNPQTVSPIRVQDSGLQLREGANLNQALTALVPSISFEGTGFTQLVTIEGSNLLIDPTSTVPIATVANTASIFVLVNILGFGAAFPENAIGGGTGVQMANFSDASAPIRTQTLYAGPQQKQQLDQQDFIRPSSGNTASRPTDASIGLLSVGQQYFDTEVASPIWWNGTDWQLAKAAQTTVIWRPGVTSAGNAVATWAEVDAFIVANQGVCNVLVDNSQGGCTVPTGTDTQMNGATRVLGYRSNSAYPFIDFEDGAVWRNPGEISNVVVGTNAQTQSNILQTFESGLLMRNALVEQSVDAIFPWITVTGNRCKLTATEGTRFVNSSPTTPMIFNLNNNYELIMFDGLYYEDDDDNLVLPAFPATMMGGGIGGAELRMSGDASTILFDQTLWTGTLTKLLIDQGAAVKPTSGDTASRPTAATIGVLNVGQPYFDTDLLIPIWWDGTQWVNAAGAPV